MNLRRGLVVADILLVGALIGLASLALIIDALSAQQLRPGPRIALGLLFALAPALIWLVFFYRRDRVEAEPKHLVATVAVVAALAAAGVSELLIDVAPTALGGAEAWVLAILVVGMIRQFTVYLVVRLVAVPAQQVNELADGIIYGTAAGVGYAVALNVLFIVDAGGAQLGPAFALITAVTLVHAALGGLIGYLVAADQLGKSPWLVPTGLVAVAIVNGVFIESRLALANAVSGAGSTGSLPAWLGMLFALLVAAAISLTLLAVMRREEQLA